jgi:hypothetical protein
MGKTPKRGCILSTPLAWATGRINLKQVSDLRTSTPRLSSENGKPE